MLFLRSIVQGSAGQVLAATRVSAGGARHSLCGGLLAVLFVCSPLSAGSHLWRIQEVFSTADGVIQFVELKECCGATSEVNLVGVEFTSEAKGTSFTFPDILDGDTSYRHLLLGTEAYAALPGVPPPDYVLSNEFFSTVADTIWYGPSRNYDRFIFPEDLLPLDGVHSIHLTEFNPDSTEIGPNSPTNWAGETGMVVLDPDRVPFSRADCNADGEHDLSDAIFGLGALFLGSESPSCLSACDANDDGLHDISDAVYGLQVLFVGSVLPEPRSCGSDGTTDALTCPDFLGCS